MRTVLAIVLLLETGASVSVAFTTFHPQGLLKIGGEPIRQLRISTTAELGQFGVRQIIV